MNCSPWPVRKLWPIFAVLAALGSCPVAWAHIGSPAAVFEGSAGGYQVRVIVLPAAVIPGRADINVRFLQNPGGAVRVKVLPVSWRAGLKGAPPPDEAVSVPGEPLLRHAELWLMTPGSYSVHVEVAGAKGQGTLIVPVDAAPTQTLGMDTGLGVVLAVLGGVLFFGAVALVAFGIRDSVRPVGVELSGGDRRLGWVAAAVATVVFGAAVYGGSAWWHAVDRDYRSNQVYRARPVDAVVRMAGGGERVLMLKVLARRPEEGGDGRLQLIPDHGKLMHVYMIREPGLDALAHIHPVRVGPREFAVTVPPLLPEGKYRLYADITDETGFADTLTTAVVVPGAERGGGAAGAEAAAVAAAPAVDPDDSYFVPLAAAAGAGPRLRLLNTDLRAGRDTDLRFRLEAADGSALTPEPYMGMLGHAAIRRSDGSVFAHIHPVGTVSMASQAYFEAQAKGAAAPTERDMSAMAGMHHHPAEAANSAAGSIDFPYLFPKSGSYRIWVQTKFEGKVITSAVDVVVGASAAGTVATNGHVDDVLARIDQARVEAASHRLIGPSTRFACSGHHLARRERWWGTTLLVGKGGAPLLFAL